MKIKKVALADESLDIHVNEGFVYDIPFSRMRTPEAILDWIHQVCIAKNWGRDNAAEILDGIFKVIPLDMWSGKA